MGQTPSIFLCHAENRHFIKSRKGKPKLKKTLWSILSIFFIGTMITSVISLFIFSLILPHYATLARSNAPIEATITDIRIEKGLDLEDEYWFDYEYRVGDVVYEGEDMLGRAEYNTYTIGMPIEIIYSPEQPSLSMIEFEPIAVLALTGIMLLFFVISLVGCMLSLLNWWSRRQLIRKGKVIKGIIEDANWSTDKDDGSVELVINYTFRSPLSGQSIQKRERLYDAQTLGNPQAGTAVAVLYLRDNLCQLL